MKKPLLSIFLIGLIFVTKDTNAFVKKDQLFRKTTIADVCEASKDSVVNVASLNLIQDEEVRAHRIRNLFVDPRKDLFGTEMLNAPKRIVAIGSGFIIRKEKKPGSSLNTYYVVTNHHIIEETIALRIILTDESIHTATLVGKDGDTDLAVLRFETSHELKVLEWGDSEKLRIGEWSIVLGNPYGLGGTSLTTGVISYLARDLGVGESQTLVDNFIQTEAAMNPGNSGGPLLNLDGKVIGVNTSIITTSGSSHNVGFAVPSSMAQKVINNILAYGTVPRAWLGTSAQSLNAHIAKYLGLKESTGALITKIIPESPAEKAGLEVGDVVIAINEKPVKKFSDLAIIGKQLEVEKEAKFEVFRHGKKLFLHPILQPYKRHEDFKDSLRFEHITPEDHAYNDLLNFGVTSLTSQLRQRFNISDLTTEGVLISDVKEEGLAEQFTLMQGDVILEINEQKVKNIADVNHFINKALDKDPQAPLLFLLHREGSRNIFVAIEVPSLTLRAWLDKKEKSENPMMILFAKGEEGGTREPMIVTAIH